MKKITSHLANIEISHIVDIACIIIAVVLTIILVHFDTEMVKDYGRGMTYFFYAVFSANLMLIPYLTYHYYND